jgi:nicotinate-nucleotide pyrophosphorylase (carboxylating)
MDVKGDLRDEIFRAVSDRTVSAVITADGEGVISGIPYAVKEAEKLGLAVDDAAGEGSRAGRGSAIMKFRGTPKQAAMAEDVLIGLLAKPSGIATAASMFAKKAGGRPRVVCGAWKKMPYALKEIIRDAVATGGALVRITNDPFVYLDKNYTEIFGGIRQSLDAVGRLEDYVKVIQLKGRYSDIGSEAAEAVEFGAGIVFIDTGRMEDVKIVSDRLNRGGIRKNVEIAFGGGVELKYIERLKNLDIDILDIGRQIVDAQLLDMKLDIVNID